MGVAQDTQLNAAGTLPALRTGDAHLGTRIDQGSCPGGDRQVEITKNPSIKISFRFCRYSSGACYRICRQTGEVDRKAEFIGHRASGAIRGSRRSNG